MIVDMCQMPGFEQKETRPTLKMMKTLGHTVVFCSISMLIILGYLGISAKRSAFEPPIVVG